jgi:hypothetical protein
MKPLMDGMCGVRSLISTPSYVTSPGLNAGRLVPTYFGLASTNSTLPIDKVFIYLNNTFLLLSESICLEKLVLSTQAFIFDFRESWQKTAVAGDHSEHLIT